MPTEKERQTFLTVRLGAALRKPLRGTAKKGTKSQYAGAYRPAPTRGNDGIKRTATEIVAQNVEFLTPKQRDEETNDRRGGRKKTAA